MNTSSKRSKAGRRAGRPGGDDQDLRQRLLDAATAQFAKVGIGATSLRAIATAADVTPALLHYYFGDKPRLVQALVEERLLPTLAPLRAKLEGAGDEPLALMEIFARGIAEAVQRHPWLPALWVREVLCEGGALREVLFTQAVPGLPQLLAQRFAAAQAKGRLNPALDPRLLVVSLVGLTLFPAAGAPIWRRVFDAEALGPETMIGHTLALLAHGAGPATAGENA